MPRKFATVGFFALTALLAGCSSTSGSAPEPAQAASHAGHGRCDAAQAQSAVGQQASAALLAQVRTQSGSNEARILGPNDMVTLEYRSDRVNINADASGKVIRVNCG
ncbi:I78 family peptidase inhibitor [Pseudomonas capsici]|uniref:I78 family peptidase inhibitor n=1 Tax=Pseudomonas capsici TaxID=2810614 RepID=UPI000E3D9763|nr:I78 family peptidase inhibitor [Pseudomonas capsici]MCV4284928.1 I78 family peptidase inhibitor [Pseudomonas capsici]MCV4344310.1 I78 family peptidase inhibitor [Pseudomonas capsici]